MINTKYQVVRPIYKRHNGYVYLVKDLEQDGCFRAMKVLSKQGRDEVLNQNEMNNLRKVHGTHNVVRVHEILDTKSAHQIYYEYCGGHTLAEAMAYNKTPSMMYKPPCILALTDVMESIVHCHQNNVVCGDLTPDTILLSTADGKYKLTEFGSSVRLDDDSKIGKLLAVPHASAPPEIFEAKKPMITFAYDVWLFGMLASSVFVLNTKLHSQQFIRDCVKENPNQRLTTPQMQEAWSKLIDMYWPSDTI
jgi:serine/threonine protein kinase